MPRENDALFSEKSRKWRSAAKNMSFHNIASFNENILAGLIGISSVREQPPS
jgi:hypothetical protein